MRIVADTTRCVSAGQCVLTDPAMFDQAEEDGTVLVLIERPEDGQFERARHAAQICPSRALSLIEE